MIAKTGVLLGACGNIVELWMTLIAQELQANLHCGLAEVKIFCAAGSALLRALPDAAALADLPAARQQQVQDKATGILFVAAQLTADLIDKVCRGIAVSGPLSAADSAAAAEALWQLHTMLCRCIHYSTAAPSARLRLGELLPSLGYCLAAAETVSRVCAALPGSTASHSVAKPRQAARNCMSVHDSNSPCVLRCLLRC
jgi:hypothetical protein